MKKVTYQFSSSSVDYYFGGGISHLREITDRKAAIIITDEHVFRAHGKRFKGWELIILKPGEEFKVQDTANDIIRQLIEKQADRKTTLIGIGGGVITDMTGYVASVYMRGIRFGFLPTTLLSLVDASIGGKNGIDAGPYKNIVGIIRQPSFILHDLIFLNTLPQEEWENGFAEIIKHACIKDAAMFRALESQTLKKFQAGKKSVGELIMRNAILKTKLVQQDEFEKGDRKLLNFGHTLGHALENQYHLSHGHAVSIGMSFAAQLSASLTNFKDSRRVISLQEKYGLPTRFEFDRQKVFEVLKMDKKREQQAMNYVLLEKIGRAVIRSIPMTELETIIKRF